MRIPPVLPQLSIQIDRGGVLTVTLDGRTYDVPDDGRGPHAVRRIIDRVTTSLGPVRIEVLESDGTVFTDIATPSAAGQPQPEAPRPRRTRATLEARGNGYLPDEPVIIAVVVAEHAADPDGTAHLHLPPAVWSRRGGVVLVGRTSGTVTILDNERPR